MTLTLDVAFPDGQRPGPYTFNYNPNAPVMVSIQGPDRGRVDQNGADNWTCTAICHREIAPENLTILRDLAEGLLPASTLSKGFPLRQYGIIGRKVPPGTPIHLTWLPEKFQHFEEGLWRELYGYASDTTKALRWRCGLPGPRSPFKRSRLEWSADGDTWTVLLITLALDHPRPNSLILDSTIITEVQAMVASQETEPAGWQILREAQQHGRSNPRSAIVLAVAAVENATAGFIVDRVPDAQWLITKFPKPPLDELLQGYLPKLKRSDGGPIHIPKNISKVVSRVNTNRNKAVHRGTDVSKEDVDELLPVAADLLALLDYYLGRKWAWNYLSAATQAELISKLGEKA